MPHLHFTAAAKKKLQEKKRFTSACVGIYLHKSPDNSKHALPTRHPVHGHLFVRTAAERIPKLCTGNPLHRTDAALPGKLDFLFFSSTIDPTIHPNGINPGVHDNCWTGQLVALSVLLPRFCATPLFLALSLRVHDLVSLLFRLLGQSELEGGEAGNRRLCPSTLDAAVLAVSEKPKATLVWPGAVCVRLPSVPHCVWVRTSKHDVIALAAFRNSWALRPSLRSTHSRALPDVRFCLINFLSGSTPPKSAKRSRLTQDPPPKKFENSAKKQFGAKGNFCFLGPFLNIIFECFGTIYDVDFSFFIFFEAGKDIELVRGTRPR